MDWILDVRLTDGPLWWSALLLGSGALAYLLSPSALPARRSSSRGDRLWSWACRVAGSAAWAFALVETLHWLLVNVFAVFPGNIADRVLLWVVLAAAACLISAARWRESRPRARAAATAAALLVVLMATLQVNAFYGLNRSVADLAGGAADRVPPLEPSLMREAGVSDGAALRRWQPQGSIPAGGVLRRSAIPGTASGMTTRDAYIYLPPAYFAQNRPALPVLVLVAGQPGGPGDWLTGGRLQEHMDAFAASHRGVAPVVVVPDPNGSQSANTMCMDTRIAQADTFLSRDVVGWIHSTLAVDTDHRQWAVGGFSFGGTCALQLGTRHPALFPAVLAFSAEAEPALAKDRNRTIEAAFPGDPDAFTRQTPLAIMERQRFDGSLAYLTAGSEDPEFLGYLHTLTAAAERAGFSVDSHEVKGAGHSWDTSSLRFADALGQLARRWGIGP
ncbi:alpha/beta hydrolase [Pseudarthrobacter sp. NPDC092424]|uniref:alpha/beta hydrolase n=1 Tax=Pseudarthrobacter sp. NPDC092424 TaxID=3364415 RepID=UPI00381A1B74